MIGLVKSGRFEKLGVYNLAQLVFQELLHALVGGTARRWLTRSAFDAAAFQQISVHGKTLRGSRDGEAPGQHLVAAYAHQVKAVSGQIRVDSKTNEHKAALELLGIQPAQPDQTDRRFGRRLCIRRQGRPAGAEG